MRHAGEDQSLTAVLYTANFALNLENIEAYWSENGFAEGYDRLLDVLSEVVVPNLERHPGMGRPFFERVIGSVEAERIVKRIASRLTGLARNAQIREYVMDEYLVLYVHFPAKAKQASAVHLLAIRHQKQLGFDLLTGR